jgi:rhodanese-related sulfurtransferase
MPAQVFSVPELQQLLEQGAQLVDVLGEEEFAQDHLPGAINIPLKRLDEKTVAGLDRKRPLLVYCNDFG